LQEFSNNSVSLRLSQVSFNYMHSSTILQHVQKYEILQLSPVIFPTEAIDMGLLTQVVKELF
jgi:hypothetical protein